ncbi:MAG: hypothetical protein WBB28_02120 [Crinalium sp.]
MSLNIELIEQLKERLLSQPQNFDINESDLCGSVACFAGHIVLIRKEAELKRIDPINFNEQVKGIVKTLDWYDISTEAFELLGLKNDSESGDISAKEKLFLLKGWPEPFQGDYRRYQKMISNSETDAEILKNLKELARIACDRLDHYVATGE